MQHLPKALLLALLVGTPVMAVDYVKCEAIQRAYGRLSSERKETWFSIRNAKFDELCGNSWDGDKIAARVACQNNNFAKAGELADKETLIYDKKIAKVKADYSAAKCP